MRRQTQHNRARGAPLPGDPRVGIGSLGRLGWRTAPGLRSQRAQIKYRKPTVISSLSARRGPGVGGLNLWRLRGVVTARGSLTGFFWRSRTFDYFSRNRRFQTTRHWRPERKSSPRNRLAVPSLSIGAPSGPDARVIFQVVRAGGGTGFESPAPAGARPRGRCAHLCARFRNPFFRGLQARARARAGDRRGLLQPALVSPGPARA